MIRRIVIAIATAGLLAACGGGSKSTEGDEKVAEQSMEKSEETAEETGEESEPADAPESARGSMASGAMSPMMEMCPMHVEGTTMALEDTEKGVAMVFTNESATGEVQERAMQMADHHAMAMDHHGSPLPAFELKAEKTDTGARVMMMPKDTAQMQAFRTGVHERTDAQGDAQCPMMMMYNPEGESHGPKPKGRMHGSDT